VLLLGGACLSAVIEMRALSSGVALPAALFTIAIGALVALMPVRGRTAEQ
jgi:hypothetical protein